MPRRLAFFGATGGCAGSCLAAALKAGYTCTALARTPAKLEIALINRSLSEALIASSLTIIPGDIRDHDAVKRVLEGVEVIVSGIGAYPRWQLSIRRPLVATDSKVCTDASATILKACRDLNGAAAGRKPIFIAVSTAGVQERGKPRALPLAYLPWYSWRLADPLADKVEMEEVILARTAEEQSGIGGYVVVKPSLLTDGKEGKLEAVRAGASDCPPVGYSVDREMVGLWMFRRLIEDDEARGEWRDRRVTITY